MSHSQQQRHEYDKKSKNNKNTIELRKEVNNRESTVGSNELSQIESLRLQMMPSKPAQDSSREDELKIEAAHALAALNPYELSPSSSNDAERDCTLEQTPDREGVGLKRKSPPNLKDTYSGVVKIHRSPQEKSVSMSQRLCSDQPSAMQFMRSGLSDSLLQSVEVPSTGNSRPDIEPGDKTTPFSQEISHISDTQSTVLDCNMQMVDATTLGDIKYLNRVLAGANGIQIRLSDRQWSEIMSLQFGLQGADRMRCPVEETLASINKLAILDVRSYACVHMNRLKSFVHLRCESLYRKRTWHPVTILTGLSDTSLRSLSLYIARIYASLHERSNYSSKITHLRLEEFSPSCSKPCKEPLIIRQQNLWKNLQVLQVASNIAFSFVGMTQLRESVRIEYYFCGKMDEHMLRFPHSDEFLSSITQLNNVPFAHFGQRMRNLRTIRLYETTYSEVQDRLECIPSTVTHLIIKASKLYVFPGLSDFLGRLPRTVSTLSLHNVYVNLIEQNDPNASSASTTPHITKLYLSSCRVENLSGLPLLNDLRVRRGSERQKPLQFQVPKSVKHMEVDSEESLSFMITPAELVIENHSISKKYMVREQTDPETYVPPYFDEFDELSGGFFS